MPKNKQTPPVKLTFVGSSYYTQESYEREAQRLGVSRAVSFGVLKTLKFGEPILLASYIGDPSSKDKTKKVGSAEVFGYFTFNGISHNLPTEYKEALLEKLTIISLNSNKQAITRACGNYVAESSATIKENLEQLLTKIEETLTHIVHDETKIDPSCDLATFCICKKCADPYKQHHEHTDECVDKKCPCCTTREWLLDPNDFKWFMLGTYTPLQRFLIKPITFTRGIAKVTLEGLKLEKQKNEPRNLIWLQNYHKRKYMPSYLKEDFGARRNSNLDKMFK